MSINNIGCSLSAGYKNNVLCALAESGIKEAFMMSRNYLSPDSYTYDSDDKIISIYTASELWYRFDQIFETSEYREIKQQDPKTGGIYWNQQLTLLFHRNRANLRKQLLQMVNDQSLACIFHTNDDRYFLVGKDRGLQIDAEIKIEKNYGGMNGQIINLKAQELYPAYEVSYSAFTYSTVTITRGEPGPILSDPGQD